MTAADSSLRSLAQTFAQTEADIAKGGGDKAIDRQHAKNRLTARERIDKLLDDPASFQELGLWYAWNMYKDHGGAPAAGVVTGTGTVAGTRAMIIANDATVKAGAFFPMTCKKIIRAQTIAHAARLPLIYLVDSAGVFLPLQEDVFPDTDDFGRIFRNNAVISADNIPQIAAIMGFCVAGGGYLPVLCDTLLMTEGSGLYLAGPALVKAAIGQEVSDEELGGADMHAAISGTIDFKEPDDDACIKRIRSLMAKYQGMGGTWHFSTPYSKKTFVDGAEVDSDKLEPQHASCKPARSPEDVYDIYTSAPGQQFDVRDILACIIDADSADEYKADYGPSIVCCYATITGPNGEGGAVGILANQHKLTHQSQPGGRGGPTKEVHMPGVIYTQAADKSARFIMDCNQRKIPLIFIHDTTGFMVGRDSEQHGIIRSGAKMVNAMSNSVVPKIVLMLGGSYGAGNYAMCGRAFDQFISLAWPSTKCAVMGAAQATGTLAMIEERSRQRKGEEIDEQTHKQILDAVRASYNEQQDIRYGAARGWVDRVIMPENTREELIKALDAAANWDYSKEFKTGVLQT